MVFELFPQLTKSLAGASREQITDTGAVTYQPRPQIETAKNSANLNDFTESPLQSEKVEELGKNLDELIEEATRLQKAFRKRAKNIVLEYNPDLLQNEGLAEAELNLFGTKNGEITYDMYEQILDLEEKIGRWLTHQSIINGGTIDGVA